MSVTNAYATLEQAKGSLGINDSMDDSFLELCVNSASRSIDRYTRKKFWIDPTVTTRELFATDSSCVKVPEGIATLTGLIVKTDTGGTGTFSTTLTIGTDFEVEPVNAAVVYPQKPYSLLLGVAATFPLPSTGRPGVQVTAKFGWPAIPDDITLACVLLAKDLAKAKDAPFGVAGSNDFGVLRITQNRTVVNLLNPYRPALIQ